MTYRNGYESVTPASGTPATHLVAQGILRTSGVFRKQGCRRSFGTVELDGVLWTAYRPLGPCSGLSGAVDVEGQAVLRNGEDLKLFIEGESAAGHSLYILKVPAAKGKSQGQLSASHTLASSGLPPPCPLAHLLQGYSHRGIVAGIPHTFPGLWWEWS